MEPFPAALFRGGSGGRVPPGGGWLGCTGDVICAEGEWRRLGRRAGRMGPLAVEGRGGRMGPLAVEGRGGKGMSTRPVPAPPSGGTGGRGTSGRSLPLSSLLVG